MPITILSPYSGKPVKVRDQDVGRAIRDEEGRIFYIVDGAEGGGHYASMTRKGSEKDEARYRKLVDGSAKLDQRAQTNVKEVHDATGTQRSNPVGILLLIVVLLALAGAGYVYFMRPDLVPWLNKNTPTPAQPGDAQTPAEGTPDGADGETPGGSAGGAEPVSLGDDDTFVMPATLPVMHWMDTHLPDPSDCFSRDGLLATAMEPEPAAVPAWEPMPVAAPREDEAANEADPLEGFRVMASGLRYRVIERGEGEPARAGHYVEVRYAAYAMDGESLIDDAEHGFILAAGQSIRALDEGLAGVRSGGQRVLFVPRGHSAFGRLPGIDAPPEGPYLLDVQLLTVRSGVSVLIEEEGIGEPAMPGDRLRLAYTATVEGEGAPFDSSELRGRSLEVTLGDGRVIPGLSYGLAGIRPHEQRVMTIPPYLAYGDRGALSGLIPPGAVLTYRVTVLGVDRGEFRE